MPLNAIYGSDIRLLTGAGSDPEFAAVAEAKMYFCILGLSEDLVTLLIF